MVRKWEFCAQCVLTLVTTLACVQIYLSNFDVERNNSTTVVCPVPLIETPGKKIKQLGQ